MLNMDNEGGAMLTASSNSSWKASDEVPNQFPAGLRILVVDDDPCCLKLLENMLRRCLYKVTACTKAVVALSMLRERKYEFDLVLSDVHMPDMGGLKLLEHIGMEMDLPVIMISADEQPDTVMKGIIHGACDYLIKPIRIEALKNIWQHVVRKRRNELKELEQSGSIEDGDQHRKTSEDADYTSSANEGSWRNSKRRKEEEDEVEERDDISTLKKQRVVWSVELHQQFVTAVNHLGIDKAVPKKILELMSVPGLTRENVASHLQKYRLYLRRISGVSVSQHQTGLNVPFRDPKEANFGPMSSLDLQTLAVSGQYSPHSLATLQAGLARSTANSGIGMTFIDQRNLFSAEASKLKIGEEKQLLNNNNEQVNLLHGLPTNMEPKQLPHLHKRVQLLGNLDLQVNEGASGFANLPEASLGTCLSSHEHTLRGNHSGSLMTQMAQSQLRRQLFNGIVGGHTSGVPLSIGQQIIMTEIAGPILGRNGTFVNGRSGPCNPVTQASSVLDFLNQAMELPVNGFPLGSTAEVSNLQPSGMIQNRRGLEVKGSRGFTPSYDITNELPQCKIQDWELQKVDQTFEVCQHANPIQGHLNPSPSILGHQGFLPSQKSEQKENTFIAFKTMAQLGGENQQGNLEKVTQQYKNLSVDSSSRIKAESMTDLSSANIQHFDEDDLMSELFKQQQGIGAVETEFNFDGYPMDDILV